MSGTVEGKQKMLSVQSAVEACDDHQLCRLYRALYRLSQLVKKRLPTVDTKMKPTCFIFFLVLIYRYRFTTINQHDIYLASQSWRRSGPMRAEMTYDVSRVDRDSGAHLV